MKQPQPKPETVIWAEDLLGGACRFHGRGSAVEGSRVWTASSASGRQAFLKEPSSKRKQEQERRALADWSPRLPGVMPRLLAASDEPLALLIEALPGLPVRRAGRSHEIEVATHRAAGAALGHLQANLVVLEKDLAFDFLIFCQRNPKPCPLLDVTDPGDPEPRGIAPGADIRTRSKCP